MNLKRALLTCTCGLILALGGILGPAFIAQAAGPDPGLVSPPLQSFTQPAPVHHPLGQAVSLPEPALAQTTLAQLPLRFIPNQGQTDPAVKFHVHSLGGSLFFSPQEVVFSLPDPVEEHETSLVNRKSEIPTEHAVVRLTFDGANPTPTIEGLTPLPGGTNFFLGNDPARWQNNLPTYEGIVYRDLYPGIDLVYRGTEGQLKSEFVVAPGANPDQIRLRYDGVESVSVREDGALVIQTAVGELVEAPLLIYQEVEGVRREVEGRYVLAEKEGHKLQSETIVSSKSEIVNPVVSFQIVAYDPSLPLVIDPELVYSSYLGGNNLDTSTGIEIDSIGNIYVTGLTQSANFPKRDPIQDYQNDSDVFLTQIIKVGGVYTYGYSTYLGGSSADVGLGIAIDGADRVYIAGYTMSANFPLQKAIQNFCASCPTMSDAFVAQIIKVSGVYTLGYSTYLGGDNFECLSKCGITVDYAGNAYVTGPTSSTNFPLKQAIQSDQGGEDVFVTQIISAAGVYTYGYSTYLGGIGVDTGFDIAVDNAGNAYVTGRTSSANFPIKEAIQGDPGDNNFDAFVTQIISTSGVYTYGYSTFLGGNNSEEGFNVAVDDGGNVYIIGSTDSTNFPMRNAIQGDQGSTDAFVAQIISTTGVYTLGYSTYLGGNDADIGYGIALDSDNNIFVTGETSSINFPLSQPLQGDSPGWDAFVTKIISTSGVLTFGYSTYLGGNGNDRGFSTTVDNLENVYIAGETTSNNFPLKNAIQGINGGGTSDVFVTKISSVPPTCFAQVNSSSTTFSSSDAQAVQQAVDAAPNGGLVKVAGYCAGVSSRAGLTQTVYISKPLTLQGGYTSTNWITPDLLAYPTTLDAQSLGRVVVITGTSGAILLENLQITNGRVRNLSNYGGGIFVVGATVAISNSQIISNTTDSLGGGFYSNRNSTLTNTNFVRNTAQYDGGGASIFGTVTITGSRFESNSSGGVSGGGGLMVTGGASITNTVFISNTTLWSGGGGAYLYGSAMLIGSRFQNNWAPDGGGLMALSATITQTAFVSNTAQFNGGGVLLNDNGRIVNSIFSRNQAQRGAGVYSGLSGVGNNITHILHTTIASPTLTSSPAIYVNSGTTHVRNSVIASYTIGIEYNGNTQATDDYNLYFNTTIPFSGSVLSNGHSLFGLNPVFANPASDDYHLLADSPSIDAGSDQGITIDFDNDPRPQGSGFDIGYDEVSFANIPALTVVKSASTATAQISQTITYTYRITNTGDVPLTNLTASDDKLGTVALNPTTLAPNQTASGTLIYTILAADLPGPLVNTVVVTGTPPTGPLITGTAAASVTLGASGGDLDYSSYLPLILKN